MAAAVEAVAAVAAVPATATEAAIPAVEAKEAIPATGAELEQEKLAEALKVAEASKQTAAPVVPAPAVSTVPKPASVPDKFWDATKGEVNFEAWNKAHTELETQFHSKPAKSAEVIAAEKVIADAASPAPVAQEGAVFDARTEFAETGALTAETYTKLAATGLDKATVDSYIAGVAEQSSKLTDAAHEAATGKENYGKMLEWAKENLSEGESTKFNALIASNDEGTIKDAVTGLYKNYQENVTVEGERIGGQGPSSGGNSFASKAEMTAAMNVPAGPNLPGKTRYETDPAYRTECQNKIRASRKAGIEIFV